MATNRGDTGKLFVHGIFRHMGHHVAILGVQNGLCQGEIPGNIVNIFRQIKKAFFFYTLGQYKTQDKTHIFLLLKLITEGLVQIPITKKLLNFGRTQRSQSVVGRGNAQCGRQNKRKQGHDTHHSARRSHSFATPNSKKNLHRVPPSGWVLD